MPGRGEALEGRADDPNRIDVLDSPFWFVNRNVALGRCSVERGDLAWDCCSWPRKAIAGPAQRSAPLDVLHTAVYVSFAALQYRPMSSKAAHACKEDTDGRRYPHRGNQPRG